MPIKTSFPPLTPLEEEALATFLASAPGAMTLPQTRGVLTGVASAPTMMMPSQWFPSILGDAVFETQDTANRISGLVLRLYNQILAQMNQDQPMVPDDDTIQPWCDGYLTASRMDEVWAEDEETLRFLFPVAILGREFDLVGEQDADGNTIKDPTPQLRRCRELLPSCLREIHHHWAQWRKDNPPFPQPAHRKEKVGRNDPCPCGSGIKYKKCCALTAN